METLTILAYFIYALFITLLTFGVGKVLFKNSKTFMTIIFNGRENLALATNKLFEVGFFLFGFGIGLWFLTIPYQIYTKKGLFEILSQKIGSFTLFIGILLFANLFLFFRGMKHRSRPDAKTGINA